MKVIAKEGARCLFMQRANANVFQGLHLHAKKNIFIKDGLRFYSYIFDVLFSYHGEGELDRINRMDLNYSSSRVKYWGGYGL